MGAEKIKAKQSLLDRMAEALAYTKNVNLQLLTGSSPFSIAVQEQLSKSVEAISALLQEYENITTATSTKTKNYYD